jgi:hypothetical protein
MHERYSYGALVFLMVLVPDIRMRWLGVAFGTVFTLNLLAAVPPTTDLRRALPVSGPLEIAGAIAMIAITVITVTLLARTQDHRAEVEGEPAGL